VAVRRLASVAVALLLAGLMALALAAAVGAAPPGAQPLADASSLPHDDDGERDDEDDGERDDEGDGEDAGPAAEAPAPPPVPAPPAPPAPATPAAPPAVQAIARMLVRPGLLSPVAGRRVGGLRPVLRWRGAPGGTQYFNLQVFTPGGRKVHSAFPRGRALKLPAGVLRPARRYVWRVWPFRARGGYTAGPLGISWLATPRAPR
jgi:hypothetical protein